MELGIQKKGFLKIDLRTKLVFIFISGALLVGKVAIWEEWLFFLISLLFLLNYKYVKTSIKFFLLFGLMWILEYLLNWFHLNGVFVSLFVIFRIMRKFIPCIMAGYTFLRTTTISEIMATTQSMKISYHYAIPFAVVVRFFPTLHEEWENIRMAMKMRGIRVSLEHILVPLLNSAMVISDELSAAALSRGLGSVEERTNVCKVKMKWIDWLIISILLVFIAKVYMNMLMV